MSPARRLVVYVLRYRRAFLLGLICTVFAQGVTLAGPRVLQSAVDDLTRNVTRAKLLFYGALLLGIGLTSGVFRFLMRRVIIGASREIEYDIRNDFFSQLQRLPLSYFHSHRTGDLMSRATNDLNAVRMMIGPSIMYTAQTSLTFVVALSIMIALDWRLTLLSLLPLPFVSISVKFFGSAIHRRFEQIQAQLSDVSAVAQECLSGVRVVRAYCQEDAELERFRRSNEEYLRRNRRLIVLQSSFFPIMSFFLGLGALVVLWIGSHEVIRGRLTLGQFVAFNAYLTMLSWPMIAIGWVTNALQRGMASWKRMLEILDTEPAIADERQAWLPPDTIGDARAHADAAPGGPAIIPGAAIRGAIEFRDVVFSFGDARVLDHVTATIAAGQTVALVGVTGSGKSTLISLLARLHDPPPGSVFIDGVDVRELPLAVVRGAIGFVPQEPFLFSDSLEDNIAFGLDAADDVRRRHSRDSDGNDASGRGARTVDDRERERRTKSAAERTERINAAAAVARLDKDVADFPQGFQTMVGERGITLSGGQKQRTALARAIAVDPRILILDDALSAVDTYTEEEILSRLREVMRQRTTILVSHRISTVRDADQVFVLDRGRIVERGTHDELLQQHGLYAELHTKQLLEEELAAS